MKMLLKGRVAVITGVSRRQGIGFAIAQRFLKEGAHVFYTHYKRHDENQPWGGDDLSLVHQELRAVCSDQSQETVEMSIDLSDPDAPAEVFTQAVEHFGHVDILVCNHARSGSDGALGELTAEMLDGHWAVNTRSSLLLAQEFAAQHDGRGGGRIILMTSGQGQGPMPGEVAYAASKAAIAGVTLTLADQLADTGTTVNTINPGPVDTGYLTPERFEQVRRMFPFGRMGEPDDPARLITWLSSHEGRWVTGQVIDSEGGFARWRA